MKRTVKDEPTAAQHCRACGHNTDDPCTDCAGYITHGTIIDGLCEPCRDGGLAITPHGTRIYKVTRVIRITLQFRDFRHGTAACKVLTALGVDFDNGTPGQYVYYAHDEGAMFDIDPAASLVSVTWATACMAPFVSRTFGIVTEEMSQ